MGAIYPDINISSPEQILVYSNAVTMGYAVPSFIAIIIIVAFVLTKKQFYNNSTSMLVASSVGLILSAMLWVMDVLQGQKVMIVMILAIASLLWTFFDKN